MDKTLIKQIAHRLKTERLSKGFTQQELSDATGISLRSVQRIESGEVYPRSFTLRALSEKLGLDFDSLNVQKVDFIPKDSTKIESVKGANAAQKVVLSVVAAIILFLLVCAFIFQSPRFPETAFELVLLLAVVIGVYGIVLFRIWR